MDARIVQRQQSVVRAQSPFSMKNEIISYLKEDPRFRERANKNKGIANLLAEKYHLEIPKDKRDDFIADVLSADRLWRLALSEDETLRGGDYGDGENLAQKKQIELGYMPGFEESIKKLNNL